MKRKRGDDGVVRGRKNRKVERRKLFIWAPVSAVLWPLAAQLHTVLTSLLLLQAESVSLFKKKKKRKRKIHPEPPVFKALKKIILHSKETALGFVLVPLRHRSRR